jgi:hypothetical protein
MLVLQRASLRRALSFQLVRGTMLRYHRPYGVQNLVNYENLAGDYQ